MKMMRETKGREDGSGGNGDDDGEESDDGGEGSKRSGGKMLKETKEK